MAASSTPSTLSEWGRGAMKDQRFVDGYLGYPVGQANHALY